MSPLPSLKKSFPSSFHRLSPIQRLQIRLLSSPSPSSSSFSSLPLTGAVLCNTHPHENHSSETFLKWSSGILVGSGLGFLYWSSSFSSSSASSSLLAFADCSAEVNSEATAAEDWRSRLLFKKFSLPAVSSKSLFGDVYRRKIFFNYEKRIRLRSPPEKVYEYFASFRSPDGELLMEPVDLMRAVVPVFPPSESNLVRDGYLCGERNPGELRCATSDFFMLFDINNDGHISFKEYIFFVTLLSIPESSFSVAFKMFDVDRNGEIDKEEFKKVMALMRAQNRQGAHQRSGLRTGLKVNGSVENGGLVEFFFDKDGKRRLKHDEFVQFMRDLHNEILWLEFAHYDYKSRGYISAKDFALSMVASADMSQLSRLLNRVDELDIKPQIKEIKITFEEFKKFASLRRKLQPFSLALFSYGKVNGLLTKADFQRAAEQVCGISLTDDMVDIIFHIFDTNRDGSLSADEFVRVLFHRERDIAQPVESGFMGLLSCCWNSKDNRSFTRLFG